MSDSNKPGIAFWIIGIIALLWNGSGVYYYLNSAFETEASTAGLTPEQIDFMNNVPAWYTAFFALAVFGGIIASILFLMKKKMAVPLFILSFVCATINQIYWLFGTDAPAVFADHHPYLMPILVVIIAVFLVWYSRDQKAKGILS